MEQRQLLSQKRPLKLQEIWAIRIRLQLQQRIRELALFNLAIDSKLRACDLMGLTVGDIAQGGRVQSRALIAQQKTGRINIGQPANWGCLPIVIIKKTIA